MKVSVSTSFIDCAQDNVKKEVKEEIIDDDPLTNQMGSYNLHFIKEETLGDVEFKLDELSNDDDELIPLGIECNVEIKEES